jgi:cysteine synthase A
MSNPLSSVKDRASLYMLRAAEERGQLTPGSGTVVEATSGNTGISLAARAAARGYRCVIVLPDSATRERINLLRALGAEVVLSPREAGYPGAIEKAEEIHRATPGSWFPCQHENMDNVRAHYETTGPEIWADTAGEVDVFVCGVGTGGTLTGIARFLKERNPQVQIVAVEPEKSPVLSQGVSGLHRIPGLNGGFVAPTTDVSCIDQIMTVSDEEALETTRALARTEGLFVGISSGAAAHACARLSRKPEYAGKTIVTLFPDTGERYLSVWHEEI